MSEWKTSREWEIDQRQRELAGKVVRGEITARDWIEWHDLVRERARRMVFRPNSEGKRA